MTDKKVLKVYVTLEGRTTPRELALTQAEEFLSQIASIDKITKDGGLAVPAFITIENMPSGKTLKIATNKIVEIDISYMS